MLMPYEQPTGRQNINNCSFKVKERFIIQQCSKNTVKTITTLSIVIVNCQQSQIFACWMVRTLPIVSDSQLFRHLSSQRNVPLDQKSIGWTACCSGNILPVSLVRFRYQNLWFG